jgi:hypothetical protein
MTEIEKAHQRELEREQTIHTPDPFEAKRYEADMALKQYKVTWGDLEGVVQAVDEHDAWARFCDGHIECQRHPKAFPRCVTPLDPKVKKATAGQSEDEEEGSPVCDIPAHEAIEKIKRMRTIDKLHHIADTDARITVAEAAKARLEELEEKRLAELEG